MHCTIIPDNILKAIKDKRSLKISQRLRGIRGRLKIKDLVQPLASILTFNTKNTTNLPGTLVAKDDTVTPDADDIAKLAHIGAKQVYNWYKEAFNRNSIDDKGFSLQSTVHYDKNYNNAFWNSKQMVYGDGDGKFFLPLAKGDDVRCHEITHGLVEHTAGLVYYAQPGALNESFADMFGISFKHYLRGQSSPDTANWILGDEIAGPDFPGLGIRSFKDEKAYKYDNQPKHMKNYSWTLQDNQGVHTNSGIPNHFFYQLCIISKTASYLQPIQLMYRVLLKLGKYSGFKTFAKTARQEAKLMGTDWVFFTDSALKEVGL